MSEPVETLETLAQKLAFTQKTLEEIDRRIAWQYVRSIAVGFGMIAVACFISVFGQLASEATETSILPTIFFWLGVGRIIGQ